jgi:curli biogenesis system outer membrane secretion channel CsgG
MNQVSHWVRRGAIALACAVLPAVASAQTPGAVQVVTADAKVFLSAEANSPVVTPVPVGAVLEVVGSSGTYYQVRLPRDSSGFDRVGFILKSAVRASAAPAAGAATAAPASTAAERKTAAVMNFDYGTVQHWWSGTWDIGRGIADMFVEQLLNTSDLRMLERKAIEAVLAEQDLANSNRAAPSAAQAASLGKVLGANLLITGSVTKFGSEEKNVGGTAGSYAGRFIGGAGAKNTTANVAVTVRAVDSTTGEILASVTGEGKSSRAGLLLGANVNGNFGSIDMNSRDFRDTILGEATDKAVKDATAKLISRLKR